MELILVLSKAGYYSKRCWEKKPFMDIPRSYKTPIPLTVPKLRQALAPGYTLLPRGKSRVCRLSIYDTFDGRFDEKGLAVLLRDTTFEVIDRASGDTLVRAEVSWKEHPKIIPPFFFRVRNLNERFADIAENRALVRGFTFDEKTFQFRLGDEIGKYLASVDAKEFSGKGKRFSYLLVRPLKGYGGETERCLTLPAETLEETGITAWIADLFTPGPRQQFYPPITPEVPAPRAVLTLIKVFVSVLEETETGIVRDWDTEFLHDYRVALRKIRTLLRLSPGLFLPVTVAELNTGLKKTAKKTGRARDLDVLLANRETYEGFLPGELKPAIDSFFRDINHRRTAAYSALKNHLRSGSYRKLKKRLVSLEEEACNSDIRTPIGTLADQWVRMQIREIMTSFQMYREDPSAEALHMLRIEGKRLRYLFELFEPIFSGKRLRNLVKSLKRFQDILGGINDISVQKGVIFDALSGPRERSVSPVRSASLGGVLSGLDTKRIRMEKEFGRVSDSFFSTLGTYTIEE